MGPEALAVMSFAGTAVSALGAITGATAAKAGGEYNAMVAENAAIATRQAAQYEEDRHRERVRSILSSQRAALGASGGGLEGSALEILGQTAADAELDALAIRYSGTVEAARETSRAAASRLEGRAARSAGYLRAGGSLLTGGSKLAAALG